jgi:hypothetical protein
LPPLSTNSTLSVQPRAGRADRPVDSSAIFYQL